MIPMYIFYSMFGFQRTADGLWAAADQMARGFLLGATAGRTTLNGEGLQHEDGHSHLIAATNPAVVAYDPAFAFEMAHILEDGLHRMYGEKQENVFYYLTVYNEPIQQPAEPEGVDVEGMLKGIYRYSPAPKVTSDGEAPRANVLASGTGMQWALKAQQLLAQDWGVAADVWSVTSWTELRRDAVECEEHNLLNPAAEPKVPYVQSKLADADGPKVAVSDWMRAVPDLISRWVPGDYTSLGTDGFGLSDTRHALRRHFHVDAESIAVAVLRQLALRGVVSAEIPAEAAKKYAIDDVTAAPVGETGGDS
jgi:pyruvate dehydrogenase E1 component